MIKMKVVQFASDNLIYNRFDLIYPNDFKVYEIENNGVLYRFCAYKDGDAVKLDVWGKIFPQNVFEEAVETIFQDIECGWIEITRAGNNYKGMLDVVNDIRILIPATIDEIYQRISRKHRYNLESQWKKLKAKTGNIDIICFHGDIPLSYVEQYFVWKKETHGTVYGLSTKEYLNKFHVTDAIALVAGDRSLAVLFFCEVDGVIYDENASYDVSLRAFSPGTLLYLRFLEELVKRRAKYLYLGGGDYTYKKRFGSEESVAYSGIILHPLLKATIDSYFTNHAIYKVAIYGLGACGLEFLQVYKQLDIEVVYGIDKAEKNIDGLITYLPEQNWPEVDAIIITMRNHNEYIEKMLRAKCRNIFYWEDIKNGKFN